MFLLVYKYNIVRHDRVRKRVQSLIAVPLHGSANVLSHLNVCNPR